MTLCPIALFTGCKQCPAFNACPLKSVIGDYKPEPPPPAERIAEQEDEEPKSKGGS
jgi:hypothetical protein